MAAPDALTLIENPGKLVKDPTDLTAADPYGGTVLGITRLPEFRPNQRIKRIIAEEWANVVDGVYLGEMAVFAAVLGSWDADALGVLFPLTSTGATTGEKVVSHDVNAASTRAGNLLSGRAHKLLFVPESIRTNHAIYLPNAVPVVDPATVLRLQRDVAGGIGAMWIGLPDANGRTYDMARLEDITL